MNGRAFKLGTFSKADGKPFAAIVIDDSAIALADIPPGFGKTLTSTESIQDLLEDWDRNFATLQEIVATLDTSAAEPVASLTALPPVGRPGKMFYAAQNFQEHVDEMLRAGMTPATGPKFTGEKSTSKPYLFLKAPSCLAGANDDIAIPHGLQKIDWEAEIALAISKRGRHIK